MEKNNDKNGKIRNLVNEYDRNRALFQEYTKIIHLLIENLLRKNNVKVQTIQCRTKEVSSFYEKLLRKKELQDKKLFEMKDLSGCRVIFYFDESIEDFVKILYNEFEIIDDEMKSSPSEYNARHIVVKLKENRSNLSEYSGFKELLCEIQLTTVLYHAWSEIQHDIIYKPNKEILDFDKPAFDYIDNYFKEIMEKHLKEASRGFSFIFYEFNKIRSGKLIINPDTINAISKSTSNNEMYVFLKLLNDYIGKYSQQLPKEYNLVDALEAILNSAERNPVVDRKTIFGNLKGITYLDIADLVLDILDKYYDVSNNLRLIIKLSKHAELRRKCEQTLQRIGSYRIGIMSTYGFTLQKIVLDYFFEQKPEYLIENLDIVLATIKPIASLECEDWSMSSPETVTFRRGCLKPTAILEGIRTRYFELTKNLLQLANKDADRKKVLNATFSLADAPHTEPISEEVKTLLSNDIAKVIEFLITYYDTSANIIKKEIQRFVYGIERLSFKDGFPNVAKLKEKIDQDANYARFRIFYGNDVDFYPNFDFKAAQEFRNQKIDEFVQQINETNLTDWFSLFRELWTNYKQELGFSMYFSIFLRKLAQQKPEIAFKIMETEELSPFLGDLLSGLIDSSEQEKAKRLLIDFSKQETRQLATSQAILAQKDYDDALFKELYHNLLKTTDTNVLLRLLQTIVIHYSKHKNHKEKVTEIINKFTTLNFFSWSFVYHMSKDYWIDISDENVDAILENLKNCNIIGYEEECILNVIAEKNPKSIIDFFHKRVELSKAKKITEPIPFEFLVLNTALSKNHKEILPEIIKWFSEDSLENWYASKLIENIFPSFSSDLESFLLSLVQKKDTKGLEIALHILEKYEGESFLYTVVREIIKLYPMDETLKNRLYRILSGIKGVVSGECGFLDAYKLKKEQIKNWLNDSSTEVKEFAVEYDKFLDELINHEKDRVDKQIAFRKREFDINSKT